MDRTPEPPTTYTSWLRPSNTATTPPKANLMGPPARPVDKKLDIHTLLSPPDPVSDSFVRGDNGGLNTLQSTSQNSINQQKGKQPASLISPPSSPAKRHVVTTHEATSPPVRDPVLFPQDDNSDLSPSHSPLFAPLDTEENRRLVDYHIQNRPNFPAKAAPPSRGEYEVWLHFTTRINEIYAANPKKYLARVRADLLEENAIINKANKSRYPSIAPRTNAAHPAPMAKVAANRVTKPKKPSANVARIQRAGDAKASSRVSQTPEPVRRSAAPNREDKDYASLPDLSPSIETLGSNPNCMKIDWKGQPLDLTKDPDAHKLHPAELALAANLRLDCATYLTSKRRMFIRRLQCLQKPKEFRKTDAQQACKIDVNKASKLWTAFDKVGWLREEWVAPYRDRYINIE